MSVVSSATALRLWPWCNELGHSWRSGRPRERIALRRCEPLSRESRGEQDRHFCLAPKEPTLGPTERWPDHATAPPSKSHKSGYNELSQGVSLVRPEKRLGK